MSNLLNILKNSSLSAYEILHTQKTAEIISEEVRGVIFDKIQQDCEITKEYFDLIEKNEGEIKYLWGLWEKIQQNHRVLRAFVLLKLINEVKPLGYEKKIQDYFKTQEIIQKFISDEKLWWRKKDDKIEIYHLPSNTVKGVLQLKTTRQILLECVKLEKSPYFEMYLTYLLTDDFRDSLMTQWVFSKLMNKDEVKDVISS